MYLLSSSQAVHTHDAIAEAAQLMKEAVDDIMVTLNEAASEVGLVGGMVESIADAMAKVSAAVYSAVRNQKTNFHWKGNVMQEALFCFTHTITNFAIPRLPSIFTD